MSNLVQRDSARNSIKRCLGASKKADSYDAAEIESYLKLLEDLWSSFNRAQDEVERTCGAETLPDQEAEREQGEEWYRQTFANFTRAVKKINSKDNLKSDDVAQPVRADVKLPRMDLPHFGGDPKDWRPFRDAFTSFIHSEVSLSGAQKLHFLRCSLQGEALQVVKAFPITNDNYEEAWQLLKKRYNVERIIIDSHFQALFSLKKVHGESSSAIKALLDATQEHFRALKALGRDVENWDDWLVHLTVSKLDIETHRQWELSQNGDKVADFAALITFLETRCRSLDAINSHQHISSATIKHQTSYQGKGKLKPSSSSLHTSNSTATKQSGKHKFEKSTCSYCSGKHFIYSCDRFRSLEAAKRISFAEEQNLCTNCLGAGHVKEDCRSSKTCRVCQVRHHTLLHSELLLSPTVSSNINFMPSHLSHCEHHVLLGTAIVKVMDQTGRYQPARLLFDNGSHATFISESCVQRLKLKISPASTAIEGIGATSVGTSKGEVQLSLSSSDTSFTTSIHAQILPRITSNLPPVPIHEVSWPHISGLKLADPFFHTPATIDILIGSDELGQFLCTGLIKGPFGTPIAQKSTLGWVLFGKIADFTPQVTTSVAVCMYSDTALTKAVSKFWHIEALPETKHLTMEEKLCDEIFSDTHYRQEDGRYVVKLPFKPDCPLGNSRNAAIRALLRMEKVFAKDHTLYTQYKSFIHEFIDLGHMEEAKQHPETGKHYYMPHRAVVKDTSTTTKLRVVFNASCRTTSGYSLNDCQMIGPQLQPDLYSTLLRLRTHRFAMSADIAKMYRQVRVDQDHIDYQRIVWRDSPTDQIKDYRLLTVTYGVASASHLAVRTLQQVAVDEGKQCNAATQVILRDFYMDDLLTGCYEEVDLQRLQVQISTILSGGGFNLRKWSSNSSLVINTVPKDQREVMQSFNFDETEGVRTLGLQWDPTCDNLTFTVQVFEIDIANLTKRLLLSDASKLFDPLGLLSPSTIIPKMLFQRLWRPKVDWDEAVPNDVKRLWLNYRNQITSLASIKVPRWVGTGIPNSTTDLHGFADASQSAYAAVVYLRTVASDGSISVQLLTAKTRVAPLKATTLSLPRLELCGAALLSQVISHAIISLEPNIRNIYGWTDSSVALAWIRQYPGKWCTFVSNRVSQIQKVIVPENWFHVRSSDNPADCATRGVLPQQLVDHPLWWNGPPWLKQQESSWPEQHLFTTNLDQRPESTYLARNPPSPQIWNLIDNYSSLRKLKNVTAYILRFLHNLRVAVEIHKHGVSIHRRTSRHLQLFELDEALTAWIKITQKHFFADDIRRLVSNKPIGRCSKLLRLHPFLDHNGLLRVGGRLCNTKLQIDKKYPLLLPAGARLTSLICEDIHRVTLHAGPQTMLVMLQSRFWVIGARQILRSISKTCVKCRRHSNAIQQQLMGDLPRPRVESCRPFLRSGVDFAGPVLLRFSKGRGSKAVKGYISIFICMATGAMHLELASDLSSSTFIAVFKRFVSRRGQCRELYSDNGTNFIGAERELRSLLTDACKDEHLAQYLANDGTIWHFNPPASPHMGGYWEAAVKRVKFHLRRTLGDNRLTFEEFTTLLTEIEACVNSRPLCAISSDVNDLLALTPGHFLIGEPLKTIPEPSMTHLKVNLVNRWQLISSLRQHFWRRWSSEYLVQLQQRSKWTRNNSNCEVGDLVVIREERLPPTKWKLGRITNVHPGADGSVRVVTLKTAEGLLKRPIVKIARLFSTSEDPEERVAQAQTN